MKVAVIGANGMLGSVLIDACAKAGVEVKGYDLPALDITKDLSGQGSILSADVLINCAAFTDVDGAESNADLAFAINRDGAGRLAEWCTHNKARMIHISTDYVFDGSKQEPYIEDDATNPLNVYGQSKLEGEQAVLVKCADAVVVRTQSLFGVRGKNFVASILNKLKEGSTLKVVTDQVSCPTHTRDLAQAILRLMKTETSGIVHCSAEGYCSWYEFACAIASECGFGGKGVLPVGSDEFPRPAKRPQNSVLNKSRWMDWTGIEMPSWQVGLKAYLRELGIFK